MMMFYLTKVTNNKHDVLDYEWIKHPKWPISHSQTQPTMMIRSGQPTVLHCKNETVILTLI